MRIHVLSDKLINKIAAGEVIDRPASVVREVVDNSIDAGADDIAVYLENGGRDLIRIVDNGCGIEKDDAILAFERHATSKIRTAEDLTSIETMGFRGEALSSIGAISKIRIRTRPETSKTATEIFYEGGCLRDVRTCAGPVGTDIEIRKLFFNTPARRKFLKKPATELERAKRWLIQSSIVHPAIRYRLVADEKEIVNLPPVGVLLERGGRIVRGNTVSFEEDCEKFSFAGIAAHPALAQADLNSFTFFVNKRMVSDRMLLRAVRDGFCSTLKDREYPLGFVSITVPPEAVDVNVHPQKSEVRFQNPQQVFGALRDCIQKTVARFSTPLKSVESNFLSTKSWEAGVGEMKTALMGEGSNQGSNELAYSHREDSRKCIPQEDSSSSENAQVNLYRKGDGEKFLFGRLRYVGQVLECYLICELEGSLYVVDMHAAHERFNYNLIRNGLRKRSVESQPLLIPVVVTLTESGLQNCIENKGMIESLGFEIEEFGGEALSVRSIPSVLIDRDVTLLIKELAAIPFGEAAKELYQEQLNHICARIACHASVRSGYRMNKEEVYALFDQLDQTEFSSACPHGRPVVVSFGRSEVEKWFGRDR